MIDDARHEGVAVAPNDRVLGITTQTETGILRLRIPTRMTGGRTTAGGKLSALAGR